MDFDENDPIDHERTTEQRAGEALKDGRNAPGLVMVAGGVVALIAGLAALATGHSIVGIVAVILAAVLDAGGMAWLMHTHRRVGRAHLEWEATHSGQPQAGPSVRSDRR